MISVLLVDDQQLVRDGVRLILSAEEDVLVIGEAADGTEAVSQTRALRPDVVLMDIQMPGLDGIEATRAILSGAAGSPPRVVVLTTFSESELVYRALTAGASGFLLKDLPAAQLVDGVRAAARGDELLAPAITRRLIERFTGAGKDRYPGHEQLTARELEIWRMVAAGMSNAEIAESLVLSVETVKTHVARVLRKLRVRDRVQAVIVAYETGVVG